MKKHVWITILIVMTLIIGSIFYLSGKWKESGETAR